MPVHNYDAIPYVGSALQVAGNSDTEVHQQAWDAVKSATSAENYAALSQGNTYRVRQSTDVQAFASVLPLYSAKIGYMYFLNLASDAKSMLSLATWAGHLSALAIGLMSFFWMLRSRSLQGAVLVAAILLLTNYIELARNVSPDIIASALTLFGLFFWVRNRVWVSAGFLFLALLFRPDTIILLFALILVSFLFKTEKLPALITFICGFFISVWVQKQMGHPGWWVHYYFSNVSIQPTLENFTPAFSAFAWLKGFSRGVFMSVVEFNWVAIFASILIALAAMVKSGLSFTNRQWALITTCILTIGGKFLVFPLPDSRLYLVFLLVIALTSLEAWRPDFAWSKSKALN